MQLVLIVIAASALSEQAKAHWTAFIRQRAAHRLADALVTVADSPSIADVEKSLLSLDTRPDPSGTVLCLLPGTSPLFDDALITDMARIAAKYNRAYRPIGAVPGTCPLLVTTLDALRKSAQPHSFFWHSQGTYNTNLNIVRAKREKLMRSLERKMAPLAERSTTEVLNYLGTRDGIAFALSYGEPVELEHYSRCPLCNGEDIQPLKCGSGHASIGFLTASASFYHYCLKCTVVFLNPQMRGEDLWRYYDEASYGAYADLGAERKRLRNLTELNTAHLANYRAVAHLINELQPSARIMDLGAGGGEFCTFARTLRPDVEIVAVDHRINETLATALHELDIQTVSGDFVPGTLPLPTASIITNWEVVEHIKLETLPQYFVRVAKLLAPDGLYILSTPDFANYYTHALDFWAMAPGEHVSVLSRQVLEPLLNAAGLTVIGECHECATMRIQNRWFEYGAANHSSMASRAESQIIEDLLQDDDMRERFRGRMRDRNVGSELILICKKSR